MMFKSKKYLDELKQQINKFINSFRSELDDHLGAINDNTNELQDFHAFLQGLDGKIEKLNEKVDSLHLFVENVISDDFVLEKNDPLPIQPLNTDEKRMFVALYTCSEPISYIDLGTTLELPETSVRTITASLIEKGIPLIKRYKKSKPFIQLDEDFKELQAKNNVVIIDKKITEFFSG